MTLFPEGSLSGEYVATFDPAETQMHPRAAVSVHAFGFRIDENGNKIPGPMNEALAEYAYENFSTRPLLVSSDVAPAFEPLPKLQPSAILELDSTTGPLDTLRNPKKSGTAGELLQAKKHMVEYHYPTLIIVAHAFHVARVARMAEKMGIVPIIPEGLPAEFDPESAQDWTTSREEWIKRERATIEYMTLRGMM